MIGAGLAGASTCVQLARRGWQLDIIDSHAGPAMAASALPVGMLSPHVTRSPTPLSRLSAIGVALTRRELEALVPAGGGWQECEVDNHGADAGRWPAALVRPSALVCAWLDEARARTSVRGHWSCSITQLEQAPSPWGQPMWQAKDQHGRVVAQAPVVVVAAALGSLDLIKSSCPASDPDGLPLRPVKGQLSLAALQGRPFSPRPQRNQGVFVPCYEDSAMPPSWPARVWTMGSTYDRGVDNRDITDEAHLRNGASLSQLNPQAAQHLETERLAGRLMGWAEVRCASLDRLPLVGALPDIQVGSQTPATSTGKRRHPPLGNMPRRAGLYTLCALGSRGLSLATLCGQTLARQLEGEPDDLDPDLMDALDPARFAWRRMRRQLPVAA